MKTFLLILLFVGFGSSYAQNNTCKKWKNGSFVVYTSEGNKTTIIRKGTKQVEVNNTNGNREVLKITWLNKCTYQLTRKRKDAISKGVHPELTITVKIIESHENHCLIFVYSNMAGDVGYIDCMYIFQDGENKSLTP